MKVGTRRSVPEAAGSAQAGIGHGRALAIFHMLMHMKRTTLILDPGLYAELRRRAVAEGRTLTEVVERTLRLGLRAATAPRRAHLTLPSYDLGPYLVDPADRGERVITLRERPEERP